MKKAKLFYHKPVKLPLFTPVTDPSFRPSCRPDFEAPKSAKSKDFASFQEDDYTPLSGVSFARGGDGDVHSHKTEAKNRQTEAKAKCVSKKRLAELERLLSDRDYQILLALNKYRFLTSLQLSLFFFSHCTTQTSQTRNCNAALKRLCEHGLIRPLKRRIGGGKGGSSVQVWHLSEAGYRLIHLHTTGKHPRKTFSEPSSLFLAHTLAIAECALQITLLTRRSHDLDVTSLTPEPGCWRSFIHHGQAVNLKPDLFAITTDDGYEDRWFIEIDLGTESTQQVASKCKVYRDYYLSGEEQEHTGMFPLVVWIVPDEGRKLRLIEAIRENLPRSPQMFLVITPDQLEPMLRQQLERSDLC